MPGVRNKLNNPFSRGDSWSVEAAALGLEAFDAADDDTACNGAIAADGAGELDNIANDPDDVFAAPIADIIGAGGGAGEGDVARTTAAGVSPLSVRGAFTEDIDTRFGAFPTRGLRRAVLGATKICSHCKLYNTGFSLLFSSGLATYSANVLLKWQFRSVIIFFKVFSSTCSSRPRKKKKKWEEVQITRASKLPLRNTSESESDLRRDKKPCSKEEEDIVRYFQTTTTSNSCENEKKTHIIRKHL